MDFLGGSRGQEMDASIKKKISCSPEESSQLFSGRKESPQLFLGCEEVYSCSLTGEMAVAIL